MSSKYRMPVATGFFLTVCVFVTWRLVLPEPPIDRRITEQNTQLEIDKLALRRAHLQRNADLWFYGIIGVLGCTGLSALIVASGIHRAQVKRAQVHTYKIGDSEVVIHERDLSLAAPVALGLMNAEQLKQMNGGMEKAFELAATMADIQSRQIRALIGNRGSLPALPIGHLPASSAAAEPVHVPTFADLLRSGTIGAQQPLLFGFHQGQPRSGTWQEIYSNATGGQSGSGKTNTLLSLIGQSVLHGIGFWIIDFHWPHEESLLAKLGAIRDSAQVMYADKPIDVRLVLDNVNDCIDRRLKNKEPSTPIRVLCIDEVLRIVKNCSYTEEIIERIGTEGRKVNVFGLFAAQSWKADKVDTTARDNLTSIFAHYMKPNQAKPLLQDSDKEKLLKKLHRGQMVFCPVMGEPEILDVPYVSSGDMETVNNLVTASGNVTSERYQPVTSVVTDEDRDVTIQRILKNPPVTLSQIERETGINRGYLYQIAQGKTMSAAARRKLEDWRKTLTN